MLLRTFFAFVASASAALGAALPETPGDTADSVRITSDGTDWLRPAVPRGN